MNIVILGGGFGGVYTLKYLHKFFHTRGLTRISPRINADVKLVLVNKKNYFLFTPLLHEFATGSVSLENLVEPIREIIRCCDYEFIHGEVKRIDLEKKVVYIKTQQNNRKELPESSDRIESNRITRPNNNCPNKRPNGNETFGPNSVNKFGIDSGSEHSFGPDSGNTFGKNSGNFYVSYDYLVIALGSKTNFYNIPGAEENSFTLKSLDDAIRLRNHFIHMFEKYANDIYPNNLPNKLPESSDRIFGQNSGNTFGPHSGNKNIFGPNLGNKQHSSAELTFVIVGGGATGVELAGEMSDYFYKTFSKFYPKEIISKVKIILIEKGNELIPQFSPKLRKIAFEVLKKKNVEVILGKGVKEVGKDFIKLDDETIIKTKTVIWTAGVEPNLPEIIGNVEKDSKGRLIVNEYLQVKNYDNVFALGDVCSFIQNQKPLPQLAQVAVRQAKAVAKNIFNLIQNKPLEKFVYRHQGDLISLGRFFAIGEIKNFTFSGFFAWLLWRGVYLSKLISNKDKIKTFIDWLLDFFYPRDITEI
jgi:NADH dehydrogenase